MESTDDVPIELSGEGSPISQILENYPNFAHRDRPTITAIAKNWISQDPGKALETLAGYQGRANNSDKRLVGLTAYSWFLQDQVDKAREICLNSYSDGEDDTLKIDVLSGCFIEAGAINKAIEILLKNPDAVAQHGGLSGRLAALLYIIGQHSPAEAVSRRIIAGRPAELQAHIVKTAEIKNQFLWTNSHERDSSEPVDERPDTYSSEKNQIDSWSQYDREFAELTNRFQSHSAQLWHRQEQAIMEALKANPGVNTVINYGCLNGAFDHDLALKNPQIHFIGYDRSSIATDLNCKKFHLENLSFLDGDFEEAMMGKVVKGKTLLTHLRVGTLMYPDQLTAFYGQCQRLGIEILLGLESVSFSELSGRYPDFSCEERSTIMLGGHLMMHDFQHYFQECGYAYALQSQAPVTFHQKNTDPKRFSVVDEVFVGTLVKA